MKAKDLLAIASMFDDPKKTAMLLKQTAAQLGNLETVKAEVVRQVAELNQRVTDANAADKAYQASLDMLHQGRAKLEKDQKALADAQAELDRLRTAFGQQQREAQDKLVAERKKLDDDRNAFDSFTARRAGELDDRENALVERENRIAQREIDQNELQNKLNVKIAKFREIAA